MKTPESANIAHAGLRGPSQACGMKCRNGRKRLTFLLCLAFGLSLPFAARSGPVCQGRWVSKGMKKDEVRELCGEPACIRRPKDVLVEKGGIFFPLAMDEEWIYNPGTGRFVEYIRFYQGEVVDVRSDGFGWTGDRDCNEIPPPQ